MKRILEFSFLIVMIICMSNCNTNEISKNNDDHLKPVYLETNKYDSTIFEDAFNKLNSGKTLSETEIKNFASAIETRADFYSLLSEFKKESLFPMEYYTFEKAGESILTNWLLYPTELDTIPSKIEFIKKVDYLQNDSTFTYYVFQFRTDEPHWAAKDGWMIGIVGPYFYKSKPYDWTNGTFSKFSKVQETTPEKEVEWVHKNIYMRSPE